LRERDSTMTLNSILHRGRCCATFDLLSLSQLFRRLYFLGLELSLLEQNANTKIFFFEMECSQPRRPSLPRVPRACCTRVRCCSLRASPGMDDLTRSTSISSSAPHLGFWAWDFRGFRAGHGWREGKKITEGPSSVTKIETVHKK
jgi:hypothetical protein